MSICRFCNKHFKPRKRKWSKFCSRDCYFANQKVPVEAVYIRDKGMCHLCNQYVRIEEASRDHVIPKSLGGPTTWWNIKLAHKSCNSHRRSMTVSEFKSLLLRTD